MKYRSVGRYVFGSDDNELCKAVSEQAAKEIADAMNELAMQPKYLQTAVFAFSNGERLSFNQVKELGLVKADYCRIKALGLNEKYKLACWHPELFNHVVTRIE